MNTLSYRLTDDNGLSFELRVDDQPIGTLVGAQDNSIPFWIIEDDLPHYPPRGKEADPDVRIVAVCSCGDYGCGHTQCRVISEGECVMFYDFDVDASSEGKLRVFSFAKSNFDAVVSDVVRLAREFAAKSV